MKKILNHESPRRIRVTKEDILLHGAAFLLPVFALTCAFILLNMSPFGDITLLNMDMWGQYFPMYTGFADNVRGASGLIWSWDGALGFNGIAQNAYYFSGLSPLVFLLFPKSMMIYVATSLIVVRSALASLFFSFLLRSKFEKKSWAIPGFSVAYGLCAWFLAFITQPMWLDGLMLLPLIIFGVERMIRSGSFLPYAAALGLAIVSNFYIGYSLCIFTALYFLWRILSDVTKETVKKSFFTCLRFAAASLLGAGCAVFVLLPVYRAISLTVASGLAAPTEAVMYHGFFDFLKNALFAAKPSLEFGAPNIYCGLFTVVLLPLFLANGGIPFRRRLFALILTAFLFLSLDFNYLDYIWHGFHFPNQLPGRWSFMLCFFILLISYEGFINLRRLRGGSAAVYFAVLPSAGIVCIFILNSREKLEIPTLIVSVGLLAVVTALIVIYALSGSKSVRKAVIYVMCAVIAAEASANGIVSIGKYLHISDKELYDLNMTSLCAAADKYRARGDEFYRCDTTPNFTFEPGQIADYYSLTNYSSTMTAGTFGFFRDLGFRVYAQNVSTVYDGSTALTNSILGVKYIFDRGTGVRTYGTQLTDEVDGIGIYENKYVLPLGFMASENALDAVFAGEAYITNQNTFLKSLSGIDSDAYTPLEPYGTSEDNATIIQGSEVSYYTKTDPGSDVALHFTYILNRDSSAVLSHEFKAGKISVIADGEKIAFFDANIPVRDLGSFAGGTRIDIDVEVKDVSFGLYGAGLYELDTKLFEDAYNKLAASPLKIAKLGGTHIMGSIDAGDGGLLATSISNDGGWRVIVDGKETEALTAYGLMLCAKLPAGEHTVEFVYSAPGFAQGLCVSAVCAAALVLWYIVERRRVAHKSSAIS